jgi:hypothetical protein
VRYRCVLRRRQHRGQNDGLTPWPFAFRYRGADIADRVDNVLATRQDHAQQIHVGNESIQAVVAEHHADKLEAISYDASRPAAVPRPGSRSLQHLRLGLNIFSAR